MLGEWEGCCEGDAAVQSPWSLETGRERRREIGFRFIWRQSLSETAERNSGIA